MGEISVYWTSGCSSCVKVKEFLTRKGVAFASINVAVDPSGMEFLASLGVRTVPVVVRGRDFFAQSLEDVASFVGVNHRAERLPPDVLMERWMTIIGVAARAISKLPTHVMDVWPLPGRPRTVRDLLITSSRYLMRSCKP